METNDPNPTPRHGSPPGAMLASLGAMVPYVLDAAVGSTPGTQVYYFHNDHLGTPQVITDESGQVVWRADYDPFGEANVAVQVIESNFRFPGQYFDEETGLHQNWFRDYAPGLGRYVEADPLSISQVQVSRRLVAAGLFSGWRQSFKKPILGEAIYQHALVNPQALNMYLYVMDSPPMFSDPYGLIQWGRLATGLGQAHDALWFAGTATIATGLTFAATGNPVLTTVVGAAMLPVWWGAYMEAKEAYHNISEALRDEEADKDTPSACRK